MRFIDTLLDHEHEHKYEHDGDGYDDGELVDHCRSDSYPTMLGWGYAAVVRVGGMQIASCWVSESAGSTTCSVLLLLGESLGSAVTMRAVGRRDERGSRMAG